MVEDMLSYLQAVRERPVWQPVPAGVKAQFEQPAPRDPEGAGRAYEEFVKYVLPYPMGNIHPRFWGWVIGTGTPSGMLAEMLAAGMHDLGTCVDRHARLLGELVRSPGDCRMFSSRARAVERYL